jgi:hypothetical protein
MRLLSRLATACVAAATIAALPSVALAKGTSPFKVYTDHAQFLSAVGATTKVDLPSVPLGPAGTTTVTGVTLDPSAGMLNFFNNGTTTAVTTVGSDYLRLTMPSGGVNGVGFFYSQLLMTEGNAILDATNTNGVKLTSGYYPVGSGGAFLDQPSGGFIGIVPAVGESCGSDYTCTLGATPIPQAPIDYLELTKSTYVGVYDIEYAVTATPEPATVALMGIGLAGLAVGGAVRRRRRA